MTTTTPSLFFELNCADVIENSESFSSGQSNDAVVNALDTSEAEANQDSEYRFFAGCFSFPIHCLSHGRDRNN